MLLSLIDAASVPNEKQPCVSGSHDVFDGGTTDCADGGDEGGGCGIEMRCRYRYMYPILFTCIAFNHMRGRLLSNRLCYSHTAGRRRKGRVDDPVQIHERVGRRGENTGISKSLRNKQASIHPEFWMREREVDIINLSLSLG